MKNLFALAAACAFLSVAGPAISQTFDVSADYRDGPGRMSGYIIYDPSTDAITDGRIESTGRGPGYSDRTYQFVHHSAFDKLTLLDRASCQDANGVKLYIVRSPPIIRLDDIREFEYELACGARSVAIDFRTNIKFIERIAPIPTLSEWALILLGVLLAGGAALTIRRRQTA